MEGTLFLSPYSNIFLDDINGMTVFSDTCNKNIDHEQTAICRRNQFLLNYTSI